MLLYFDAVDVFVDILGTDHLSKIVMIMMMMMMMMIMIMIMMMMMLMLMIMIQKITCAFDIEMCKKRCSRARM